MGLKRKGRLYTCRTSQGDGAIWGPLGHYEPHPCTCYLRPGPSVQPHNADHLVTPSTPRENRKRKKKKYRGEEGMAVKADHRTAGVSSPVCARPRVGSVQPNDNTACGSPHSDSTPPSNVNMSKGRTRNRQSPKAGDSPGALAAVLLSWGQCRCSLPGVPPEPFKNQALQGLSRVPCGSGTEVCTEAESWS